MTALRLLGAALVAASGCALGLRCRARLQTEAEALSGVCTALALLRAELTQRCTPLPELAARLGEEGPESCRAWFSALARALETEPETRFSALWRRTLEQAGPPLTAEVRAELCRLGLCLGRYDAPEQAAEIDRCLAFLQPVRSRLSDAAREKGKLCTGLGLAGGLLLAVVLL